MSQPSRVGRRTRPTLLGLSPKEMRKMKAASLNPIDNVLRSVL